MSYKKFKNYGSVFGIDHYNDDGKCICALDYIKLDNGEYYLCKRMNYNPNTGDFTTGIQTPGIIKYYPTGIIEEVRFYQNGNLDMRSNVHPYAILFDSNENIIAQYYIYKNGNFRYLTYDENGTESHR